jgi:hypothetical protein
LIKWIIKSYYNSNKVTKYEYAAYYSPGCSKASEVVEEPGLTSFADELKAYPNPATDKVNIILTEALADVNKEDINVFDLYGNVCNVKSITSVDGVVEIDISGLKSGLYFVYIATRDTKEMLRIIKQ